MNLQQIYTEILQVLGNHINDYFEFGVSDKIGVKNQHQTTYLWYGTEPNKNREIYTNICDLYKLTIDDKQSGNYLYIRLHFK